MSGSITVAAPAVAFSATGPLPQSPATIRANLVALAATYAPGFTADLPGSLVGDLVGTAVAGIVQIDQARVDLINSVTPLGANPYLLNQLGQQLGIQQGASSNTSVNLVFSGPAGYPIAAGFTVSDGTHNYVVQDGGVIQTGGVSLPLYAVATTAGSFSSPAGTVTQIATSVPSTITLTVSNPLNSTPGAAAQAVEDYQALVLMAQRAPAQSTQSYLKSLLLQIAGVQSRLVSVRQVIGVGWEVIVGGGDPYQIGYAILASGLNLSTLVGSTMAVTGITQANPGVVTSSLNHGFTTGQVIYINGIVGMTALNGVALTITVLSLTTFSIGVNTSAYPAWVSGGVVTPNLRNQSVQINNVPDTYTVPFVLPPQQSVVVSLLWNTIAANFTAAASVNSLGAQALIAYVNTIGVGQPILVYELQRVFKAAISNLLASNLISRLVFSVAINGVNVGPLSGTGVIAGDPESYFFAGPAGAIVSQG